MEDALNFVSTIRDIVGRSVVPGSFEDRKETLNLNPTLEDSGVVGKTKTP